MQNKEETGLSPRRIRILENVKIYICDNIDCRLDVQTLAARFNMGASTLRRHFIHHYGMPVHSYILNCRMDKAMELLVNRIASIKEIAGMTGYKNRTAFTHSFIRYFGHSPAYYFRPGK